MRTLLNKVQLGITTGAALWLGGAGCSEATVRPALPDADTDAQMMTSDAGRDSGRDAIVSVDAASDASVGVDGAIADAGRDAATLQPYSLDDLVCGGMDAGTFCCFYATCVEVANTPCPAATDPALPFQPFDLTCGVTGPFAPNPEDVNATPGNCCYVTGSQAAVGRPLLVEHAMIVAAVVKRSDWLLG